MKQLEEKYVLIKPNVGAATRGGSLAKGRKGRHQKFSNFDHKINESSKDFVHATANVYTKEERKPSVTLTAPEAA